MRPIYYKNYDKIIKIISSSTEIPEELKCILKLYLDMNKNYDFDFILDAIDYNEALNPQYISDIIKRMKEKSLPIVYPIIVKKN